MEKNWTIRSVLAWAKSYLEEKKIASPRLEAEILLSSALGVRRIDLYMDMDRPLVEDELASFRVLLKRRSYHEPVAYILGEKEFFSRKFIVNKSVLIPRPETEILVEKTAALAPENAHILEIGVGSGALVISILLERPDLKAAACDISVEAAAVAHENASLHGVNERLDIVVGDGLSPFGATFDVVVMNPPYIRKGDFKSMDREVYEYEPECALFGGNDGLDVIKQILVNISDYLNPKGIFLMEIGFDQQEEVEKIVKEAGGLVIKSWEKDLAGHARAVIMERVHG